MEEICQEDADRALATPQPETGYNIRSESITAEELTNSNGFIDNVCKNSGPIFSNKEGHLINHSSDLKCEIRENLTVSQRDCAENGPINCPGIHDNGASNKVQLGCAGTSYKNVSDCKDEKFVASIASQNVEQTMLDENRKIVETTSNSLSTLELKDTEDGSKIEFVQYKSENQLPDLVALITVDLSEPYSIYTYRYFLHNWPHLSHLAYDGDQCVGAIVCKLDIHRKNILRGYIAMLVVHKNYRRCKIGSSLVKKAVKKMIEHGCEEVVLETEVTNKAALKLYENLGFVRDKRLLRYYLNGVDAWRLKLWLK